MFCYHCQEAKKNTVCDTAGICGKKANVSSLQDMLMFSLKGLAFYTVRAEKFDLVTPQTNQFLAKALFSMVTNVNFAPDDFVAMINEAVNRKNSIREQFLMAYSFKNTDDFSEALPEEAKWQYAKGDEDELTEKGATVGVERDMEALDEDVLNLQECLLYAVKGLGSLAIHNLELDIEDNAQYRFMHQALNFTLNKNNTIEDILPLLNQSGELGLQGMDSLASENSKRFGDPVPSTVYLDTQEKPGILVSGNDLHDIEDLLEQTAEAGVDVYTHGEAVSAHTYPALKKYFNLVANYGGAWQNQKTQFPKFNGPILVTTNSIQQPKKTYQEKIFSTGTVGWPGVSHIADRKKGQRKDFSAIIALAQKSDVPNELTEGQFMTGYGQKALSGLVDKTALAIKAGKIKQIVIIAGIDGRHKERKYYAELATTLPEDTLIMSAGDTKYRFYQHDFGLISDIPRFLDVGQSNDFGLIIGFLKQLKGALSLSSLNELPVSFNIAWYEQKTILMMLSVFALGFRQVRVGPTLPPFFTENIVELLADKYGLKGIDSVENDIDALMAVH